MKNKLLILTICLFLLNCSSGAQKNTNDNNIEIKKHQNDSKENREAITDSVVISLKWKINPNEIIGYKTAMEQVESSEFNIDFGSEDNIPNDEFKKFFDELKDEFEKTSLITTMKYNERNNIEIKLFTEDFNTKSSEPVDPSKLDLNSFMKGVMLRGEIDETGNIESFYVNTSQKNLIALLFELPNKPIKLGDTWSLNVNLIQFDNSFICKSAEKENKVELIDLIRSENDTIAVFRYSISENAIGYMTHPLNKEKIDTEILITFNAIAEFSVVNGCWINYNGIFETNQLGIVSFSNKQKFSLIPYNDITKEMIDIE